MSDEAIPIPLDVAGHLAQRGLSGMLTVIVEGMPAGASLSAGTNKWDGTWSLVPRDLSGLCFIAPRGRTGGHTLTIRVLKLDSDGFDVATTAALFDIRADDAAGGAGVAESSGEAAPAAQVPMEQGFVVERLLAQAREEWQAKADATFGAAQAQWASEEEQRLAQARAAWEAEEEERRTAADAALTAEEETRLAAARAAWEEEANQRLTAAESTWSVEEKRRRASAKAAIEAEVKKHLTRAQEAWRAEEQKRLEKASAVWESAEQKQLEAARAAWEAAENRRLKEAQLAWQIVEDRGLALGKAD